MEVVAFFQGDCADARGEKLVRLAASRGWFVHEKARRGKEGNGGIERPASVVAPEGWEVSHEWAPVKYYRGIMNVGAAHSGAVGGEWVTVRNGRYAVEVDGGLLDAVKSDAGCDVIAVTVTSALLAYRERLVVNGTGRVLGFRRFYHDGAAPAAIASEYPHLVMIKAAAARRLEKGVEFGGGFGEGVRRWREAGLSVKSFSVAGEAYDLSREEGLRAYWATRAKRLVAGNASVAGARIEGQVVVEAGASVGAGAVVVGPAFVGEGARIGENAVVSGSLVGPGAEVAAGEMLRDGAVFAGEGPRKRERGGGGRMEEEASQGKAGAFRQWRWWSYARLGKRIVDIVGSVMALAVLAAIFPILAVAIKVNSRGPIFYAHRRQGLHGREFLCLKFRTMLSETGLTAGELRAINEVDGPQFKVENDPRITLVGDFLRETNIDEVPQFLNVLAGQMSIVGPRPSPDEENQMCPAWREARLSVRPGITGAWQVWRLPERRNDFQEWIHYDTQYVRTLSFGGDMEIMARTVLVLLRGFAQLFVAKRGA